MSNIEMKWPTIYRQNMHSKKRNENNLQQDVQGRITIKTEKKSEERRRRKWRKQLF